MRKDDPALKVKRIKQLRSPESREKAVDARLKTLTLKQKVAVGEYLRTGNKSAAIKAAYNVNPKHASMVANKFFKAPKIVDALSKALKNSNFDDQYAIETLKKIIQGGMENIDITRPDTSLKGLETYFKITGKMGSGTKTPTKIDPETAAKHMDMSQLQASLKELDKKQKRILSIITGTKVKQIEGEIL